MRSPWRFFGALFFTFCFFIFSMGMGSAITTVDASYPKLVGIILGAFLTILTAILWQYFRDGEDL
ncbi:hypothetical protein Aura_00036 [Pseudomonas phage vB_PpuM-Aura]